MQVPGVFSLVEEEHAVLFVVLNGVCGWLGYD